MINGHFNLRRASLKPYRFSDSRRADRLVPHILRMVLMPAFVLFGPSFPVTRLLQDYHMQPVPLVVAGAGVGVVLD